MDTWSAHLSTLREGDVMISVSEVLSFAAIVFFSIPFVIAILIDITNVYAFIVQIMYLIYQIRYLKKEKFYSIRYIPSAVVGIPLIFYFIFIFIMFTFAYASEKSKHLFIKFAIVGAIFSVFHIIFNSLFIMVVRRLLRVRTELFAQQTGNPLLVHLQHHRFQQAHALLSPIAQARYSPKALEQKWRLLEGAVGTVQSWRVSFLWFWTETENIFARLTYRLKGSGGEADIELRLRTYDNHWQVEEVEFGRVR
ncbi:MAG: hypothetical protein SNJ72_07735 [Fimbriimonadales bacterium]